MGFELDARRDAADLKEKNNDLQRAVSEFPAEIEIWRQGLAQAIPPPSKSELVRQLGLEPAVQAMVRAMVPQGHARYSACNRASTIVVEAVDRITNVNAWRRYVAAREEVRNKLRDRHDCPSIRRLAPSVHIPSDHLPFVQVDLAGSNEVVLLHGTSPESARRIAAQGFCGTQKPGSRSTQGKRKKRK